MSGEKKVHVLLPAENDVLVFSFPGKGYKIDNDEIWRSDIYPI